MKKINSYKNNVAKILGLIFFFILLMGFYENIEVKDELLIRKIFLETSNIWEGDFQNYVNMEDGIIQKGKIIVEVTQEDDQIVKMRNKFINPDGKQSDYTGYSSMQIKNNRLLWVGDPRIDENTGNKIENHIFKGYILDNQIYILEQYSEVFPDGHKENRRNTVHYYLINKNEILQMADVYVNDSLLVFASTLLKTN